MCPPYPAVNRLQTPVLEVAHITAARGYLFDQDQNRSDPGHRRPEPFTMFERPTLRECGTAAGVTTPKPIGHRSV